ncbi:MAG: hypothetical protein JWP02_2732 [Acidimicrobiales bacterium]|nr:hypothetical protein [Acidimicrobiales bacterium]
MVIQTTTFRLAGGADERAFLEVDERVRTGFLYRQPGLLRATTARADGGEWIVVVVWASADDADAAATRAATDPITTEMSQMVDAASVDRRRYATLD